MQKRYRLRAMRITSLTEYTARLLAVVSIVLLLVGFLPTPVRASTDPVDLTLGGEGSTPWAIGDIIPGDSGTKTVELHNEGTKDGYVTIWLSDINSIEGVNPESETGDINEPGEFNDYLELNLTAYGLNANLDLPVTVSDFPHSATDANSVEIIPLKSGATINLIWEWELPPQVGNDVQGDSISFTANYMLQECNITDVSGVVTPTGLFTTGVTANSTSGKGKLTIIQGTTGKTKENQPLSDIWIIELDKEKPPPPPNKKVIGFYYEAGPEGATFDQPITISLTYQQNDIPKGVKEKDLVIALWDKNLGQWVELENCSIDTVNNIISSPITHFSRYAILSPTPPSPPSRTSPPTPSPIPGEEETHPTPQVVQVDMLGNIFKLEIGADGIIGEPFTLTDRNGNFTLDIKSGTKIMGLGNKELSSIELRMADTSIVVPDNTVILSPTYQLTGFTLDTRITRIDFSPSATLTIRYDPKHLPENALVPIIVNYSDELGLVQLSSPLDEVIEIGLARAIINHASLFAVIVEVPPPPPPLPAYFEVSNLTINPKQAQLGQPVTINVTISNTGATEGNTELYLIIDGMVRFIREVTLAGNSSQTLTFELSNLSAGRHEVRIAGLNENFNILSTAVVPLESKVNWYILDMVIVGSILLGLLTLYLFRRRL
ncbi:hypothetical protein ACFLYC_01275 [Chloroflexota bacterium]